MLVNFNNYLIHEHAMSNVNLNNFGAFWHLSKNASKANDSSAFVVVRMPLNQTETLYSEDTFTKSLDKFTTGPYTRLSLTSILSDLSCNAAAGSPFLGSSFFFLFPMGMHAAHLMSASLCGMVVSRQPEGWK